MIVMCPGFHDHYASISAENRELDQESRLSLIGPKIQHKTCSHSIYAWEIRNWHCGACGALGGAFPLSPQSEIKRHRSETSLDCLIQ